MRATLAVVCLLALAAIPGAAVAADNPGLADFEPGATEAAPGETVEIDLTMQVVSTNDDEAVGSIAYTVVYDPDVLSVADVEQGPWMSGGDATDVTFETEIDDDEGRVHVEEAREPPAGGVIGDGTTATVTFEVDPGATAADTTVEYDGYEAQMLEYPLPVLDDRTEATITVTEEPTEADTDDQAGFGIAVALVALSAAVIARTRQTA